MCVAPQNKEFSYGPPESHRPSIFRSTRKSKRNIPSLNLQSTGEALLLIDNTPFSPVLWPLPARYRNLTPWAENGVLMLNTCLTVRAAQAGSHSNKGWEEFTDKVVDVVDKYGGANLGAAESTGFGRGVVFLAWGSWAAKRVAKLSKVGHSLTHPRLRGPR